MANTTEVGCPGGNEGCKRQEVISAGAEKEGNGRAAEMVFSHHPWSPEVLFFFSNNLK